MKQQTSPETILAFIAAAERMPSGPKKELWVSWLVQQWESHCPKFEIRPRSKDYLQSPLNKKKGDSNDWQKKTGTTVSAHLGQRPRPREAHTVFGMATTEKSSQFSQRRMDFDL